MSVLTGVMGGMFDPVHLGHLQAARVARQVCGLQRVLLVPCGNPVHRGAAITAATQRCAMLSLAIAAEPGLELDTRECDSAAPSRSVVTLQSLHRERPDETLCFILGVDAFLALASWYRWRELFDLAHLIVITRPGYDLSGAGAEPAIQHELRQRRCASAAALADTQAGRIFVLEAATPQLSSSEVRARLAAGMSVAQLLPAAVADYIETHQLYRAG